MTKILDEVLATNAKYAEKYRLQRQSAAASERLNSNIRPSV